MAKSNASSSKLYLVESAVNKLVAELTSLSLAGNRDLIDLTTKDNDGFRDFIPGLGSYTLNVEGMVDFQTATDSRNLDDLVSAFRSKTLISVLIKNSTSGDTTYAGSCYVTAFEYTSPMEAALTFTSTLELKGDITVGTVS